MIKEFKSGDILKASDMNDIVAEIEKKADSQYGKFKGEARFTYAGDFVDPAEGIEASAKFCGGIATDEAYVGGKKITNFTDRVTNMFIDGYASDNVLDMSLGLSDIDTLNSDGSVTRTATSGNTEGYKVDLTGKLGAGSYVFSNDAGTSITIRLSGQVLDVVTVGANKQFTYDGSSSLFIYGNPIAQDTTYKWHINAGVTAKEYCRYAKDNVELANDIANLTYSNAGYHNSVYRGKYLGTSVTDAQWSAIQSGTFTDLYIGDYWTIGGVNWRIASFDYWLNTGDTNCTTHHAVIVPDTCLYNAKMNDTDTTVGAYVGSAMYTANLDQAKTTITNAFGSDHILSHRGLLSTVVTSGKVTGWGWKNSSVELLNECMLYGNSISSQINVNSVNLNVAMEKTQLPLFSFDPTKINNRASYWLRDVVSATSFSAMFNAGYMNGSVSSSNIGVRPVFAIK